jgi:hypothetical protein
MRVIGKFRTWCSFSPAGRRRVLLAGVLLVLARVGVWILPFQRMAWMANSARRRHRLSNSAEAYDVGWAVRVASRYVPRATCLIQALAAHVLLGWSGRRSCLHIGVAMTAKEAPVSGRKDFAAHAWVECEGQVVVGDLEDFHRYTEIYATDGRPVSG